METYFEASSLLLTNYIFPTTKLVFISKKLLQCFMHIHERDTVRYIWQYFVLWHPQLGPSISCTWCCRWNRLTYICTLIVHFSILDTYLLYFGVFFSSNLYSSTFYMSSPPLRSLYNLFQLFIYLLWTC